MPTNGIVPSGPGSDTYWALLGLDAVTGDKTFRSFGSYRDVCVKVKGVWLIQEKCIDPWKSEEPR